MNKKNTTVFINYKDIHLEGYISNEFQLLTNYTSQMLCFLYSYHY